MVQTLSNRITNKEVVRSIRPQPTLVREGSLVIEPTDSYHHNKNHDDWEVGDGVIQEGEEDGTMEIRPLVGHLYSTEEPEEKQSPMTLQYPPILLSPKLKKMYQDSVKPHYRSRNRQTIVSAYKPVRSFIYVLTNSQNNRGKPLTNGSEGDYQTISDEANSNDSFEKRLFQTAPSQVNTYLEVDIDLDNIDVTEEKNAFLQRFSTIMEDSIREVKSSLSVDQFVHSIRTSAKTEDSGLFMEIDRIINNAEALSKRVKEVIPTIRNRKFSAIIGNGPNHLNKSINEGNLSTIKEKEEEEQKGFDKLIEVTTILKCNDSIAGETKRDSYDNNNTAVSSPSKKIKVSMQSFW